VSGNTSIGAGYAAIAAPANGAIIQGNVGVGTSKPVNDLTVSGNTSIGAGYAAIAAPANGAIIQGNVGVGTSKPVNDLTVSGNTSIGAGYAAIAAPANGAIIQGNVGVGTSKPVNDLTVSGNTSIGAGFAATAAPVNGAIIQGNVGVGTAKPVNKLTVSGNTSIGAGFAAIAAPANGAIIQGNVGLGTATPKAKLDIIGKIKITDGTQGEGKILTSDTNGVGTWRDNIDLPDLPRVYATGRKTTTTTCTGISGASFALTNRRNMNADGSFVANKSGYYQITASISQFAEAFSYLPNLASPLAGNMGYYFHSYTFRSDGWNWYKNSVTVLVYATAGTTIGRWGWHLGGSNTCNSTNRIGNQEVVVLYMGN
jgi:hypothetical protein